MTPIATASTFFRCVPVYNTTNAASAQCVFPTSISSASDPACVLAQTFKTGVTTAPAQTNQLFDLMSTSRSIAGRWFGDLVRAWWVLLLCAIGVPLILAFIWLMLAKACTVVFVWATIILLMSVLTAFTIYLYYVRTRALARAPRSRAAAATRPTSRPTFFRRPAPPAALAPRAQKGGLITSFFPPSIQDEVNVFTTAVDGAINTVTYWVPQQFDVTISADTYKIVAYVFTGITIIVLCIVVALRGAIRTATKAIELGAEALQEIPSLLLFPITTVAVLALFMMWWVFVVAGLTTAGTAIQVDGPARALAAATALAGSAGVTNATLASFLSTPGVNATYTAIQDVTALQYLLIYYFFGLLWTGSFVTGCATLIVAGAVAAWYFGRVPSGAAAGLGRTVHACNPFGCCMGRRGELAPGAVRPDTFYTPEASPVCASVCRLLKYYLGTVALGSFFIAFLGFVRAVLAYVYRRLRAGGSDSPWLKFLCCCVQCCLGCLQRFVELITRNAYIYTAIKGTGFCGSSAAIFGLLVANAGTVAAVTILSEVILFLGKVLIAAGSTWVAWAVLDNTPAFNAGGASPLTSTWLVIVINFFFAYLTASAFMLVFDLAIDTVLICYLLDRGENGGLAAHVDAAKFNEIEREAAAEARAHALGGAPDKAAAAQPQQPPLPQLPTPMYVSDPGAVVAAGGTFSYAHPGRSEVVAVPPAGSAAAYVV